MEWSEAIYDALSAFRQLSEHDLAIDALLPFWDVTNLQETADETSLLQTFQSVEHDEVYAPAVCVYPKWVPFAVSSLSSLPIHVGTVVNFPKGDAPLQAVGIQIEEAVANGAREIDAVFPYTAFLAGERDMPAEFVSYCKSLCGKALLKVILETGVIQDPLLIIEATQLAASAGADFIKTSTGKVQTGATFEAAAAVLLAIQSAKKHCSQALGLKVSGGIRTLQEASRYKLLAEVMMGEAWVTPRHFRIGASKLA